MNGADLDERDVSYALVCLKTGAVLDLQDGAVPPGGRLTDLASATPELFRAGAPADLAALFLRLGSEHMHDSFQEIVFLSARAAHVLQRIPARPELALLAICFDTQKLGLMLSGVRARLSQMELVA